MINQRGFKCREHITADVNEDIKGKDQKIPERVLVALFICMPEVNLYAAFYKM